MTVEEAVIPRLTFNLLRGDRKGRSLATSSIAEGFGQENFDEFRKAGRRGIYLPDETRQRVDREMYRKVELAFNAEKYGGKKLWHDAMSLARESFELARQVLLPDQARIGTMITSVYWSDNRPSTVLEALTAPTDQFGLRSIYEQGRQTGLAILAAEVILENENGEAAQVLRQLNDFSEKRLFLGKRADPRSYSVFSYHRPFTNVLVGVSSNYPDHTFSEDLWVKKLEFSVRRLGIRNGNGEIAEEVPVLYEPREKKPAVSVIKAQQRSFKTATKKRNGGLIEASPYMGDRIGFKLVLMQGGHPLRDRVTAYLEKKFKEFEGFERMDEDNRVDPNQGDPARVHFQRRNLIVKVIRRPIEIIVESLEDWIRAEYEVGNFNPTLGRHDGIGHPIYRLGTVIDISGHIWPYPIFKIDTKQKGIEASYANADMLGRKQRIRPSPYEGMLTN